MTNIEEIRALVQEHKLEKALQVLQTLLREDDFFDEILLLSSRQNKLKKQIRMDIINPNDANIENNKITFAILEILTEFEKELAENKEHDHSIQYNNYASSLVKIGRQIRYKSEQLPVPNKSNNIADLLTKVSTYLEEKIENLSTNGEVDKSFGKLKIYSDYLPSVLKGMEHVIDSNLAKSLSQTLNEVILKKGDYIISMDEDKLYETKDSAILIKQLKIASGYFSEAAELLR